MTVGHQKGPARPTQITPVGAAPGGYLSNQVAEQNGGYAVLNASAELVTKRGGDRHPPASMSQSRSVTRSSIRGDGWIWGLGGCRIASLAVPVQAGKAGPRSS